MPTLFVNITNFHDQLVFYSEQMHTVTTFGEHGIMGPKP